MTNKKFRLGMTVLVLVLSFSGCATMIHTEDAKVQASSGTNIGVQVFDNGAPIYSGTLPAQFPVKSGHTYTVQYSAANGEARIITIGEKFNAWVIGSVLLGLLPVIVDVATGNIMQIEETTIIPIGYSPMIVLGENIAYNGNLDVIGNFLLEK